jgi:hypothetical protein
MQYLFWLRFYVADGVNQRTQIVNNSFSEHPSEMTGRELIRLYVSPTTDGWDLPRDATRIAINDMRARIRVGSRSGTRRISDDARRL